MDVPERIDHTVLGPETTSEAVQTVLDEARDHGMNACVPPWTVADAAEYAPEVTLVTVVGFPHGQHRSDLKATEAERAWEDGADEIDVVANLGLLRAAEDEAFERDLEAVVSAVPVPVKVIVEAPLLTDDELHRAAQRVSAAGADYVKTATGFADGGATVADVALLSEYLPVKASGGIGSWERARAMFEGGADRIGASSGATIVAEWRAAAAEGDSGP